jgi:chromosome segregation ATPase
MSADLPTDLTPAELRRRIRAVAQRTGELRAERRALEEVRDSLAGEERRIAGQLDDVGRERSALEQRLAAELRRIEEVDEQIERVRLEAPILERRRREDTERADRLAAECAALEEQTGALRRQISNSSLELKLLEDSLARLDQRLHLRGPDDPRGMR